MADGEGRGEGPIELEHTPTWIVATVCSCIVFISFVVERLLHFLGKVLKRRKQKPLFEALQKVKEELMVMGFISLLLTVSEGLIHRICIPVGWTEHMLPCKKQLAAAVKFRARSGVRSAVLGSGRRLLSKYPFRPSRCMRGKIPLLSAESIDQLHIFIFVLAITHVCFSLFTMILCRAKLRQWKQWEDSIHNKITENVSNENISLDQSGIFGKHITIMDTRSRILSWLYCFGKQFYGPVTKSDYTTMRLGFIMIHSKTNPKFDFHKYMVQALEADFKKVIGIRWHLWIFVVFFLLLNINGLNAYFWIAFIPLILLLAVGTKLEHIIAQLAHEVTERHSAIGGDSVVKPSDDLFWLHRPRLVLYLMHFILFQNAFEIAFFFWIMTTDGFHSCIMGQGRYIAPRLTTGVMIQLLCIYSTLPIYAIVNQMGSSFKKAALDEHLQEDLLIWALRVKGSPSVCIQLQELAGLGDSPMEEGRSPEMFEAPSRASSDTC